MANVWDNIVSTYNHYVYDTAEPKSLKWPLMGSPIIIVVIIMAYLYIVLNAGPKFMRNRKPFKLKKIIMLYDAVQIFMCAYVFQGILTTGWSYHVPRPGECGLSLNKDQEKITYFMWVATLVRIVDLVDTVFFVLRKKYNQVTFLHVYHHVSSLVLIYIGAKYKPDTFTSFPVFINSFVHVLMYTYYLAASLKASAIMRFKKYLTILQLIQFGIFVFHVFHILPQLQCPADQLILSLYVPSLFIVYYLFFVFYKKSYMKKQE